MKVRKIMTKVLAIAMLTVMLTLCVFGCSEEKVTYEGTEIEFERITSLGIDIRGSVGLSEIMFTYDEMISFFKGFGLALPDSTPIWERIEEDFFENNALVFIAKQIKGYNSYTEHHKLYVNNNEIIIYLKNPQSDFNPSGCAGQGSGGALGRFESSGMYVKTLLKVNKEDIQDCNKISYKFIYD